MRAALLVALLVLLLPPRQAALARTSKASADTAALRPVRVSAPTKRAAARREPWLYFPIDVRRFEHVSSRFGVRRLSGHKELHRGVDLVAPAGSWVVAAREGQVADTGRARACGWYVTVLHANSWRTVYCHLRGDPRLLGIAKGLYVPVMGVIGEVGSTGHSTGPHLHFSLLDDRGEARNPLLALFTPAETLRALRKMRLAQ